MTTSAGTNEIFRPTPIQFGEKYDVTKMRRLAADVVNIANRLASFVVSQSASQLPSGGSAGQVLTKVVGGGTVWANQQVPTSVPWSAITGVPAAFPPTVHLIASTTGVGPAHTISALGPGQVLVSTSGVSAVMRYLNYADLADVNLSALADTYIPSWSAAQSQWVMIPQPTVVVPPTTFQPEGQATGVQWGVNPVPLTPMRNLAGTTAYAQLNIPPGADSILGADYQWHPVADVEISWSQISDVPALPPPPTGTAKKFLRDDYSWQPVTATGSGASAPSVVYMMGDDGNTGDDGVIGASGPQGPQGLAGPPGGIITTFMVGDDGAPGEDGMPMPGLQGAQGAPGASGVPGLGLPGDDGTPGDDAIPMPGIQGATGSTGLQGPPGWPGDDGTPGDDGIPMPGLQGPQGPAGIIAPPHWADDGNPGDDAMPMPGIQGPMGPSGISAQPSWADDGNTGDDGMPMPGIQGANGANGAAGIPGLGLPGDDGTPGDDAIPMPGLQGPVGGTGLQGLMGYPGDDGTPGDDSFIPGPPGATGSTGAVGPPGLMGIPGDDGMQGDDGIIGAPGIQGPAGTTGPAGPIGLTGDDGMAGDDGINVAIPGPTGPQGPQGTSAAYNMVFGQALADIGQPRRAGVFYIEVPGGFTAQQIGFPAHVWQDQGNTEDQMTQIQCTARVVSKSKIRVYFMSANNNIVRGVRVFNYLIPTGVGFTPVVPKPAIIGFIAPDYA